MPRRSVQLNQLTKLQLELLQNIVTDFRVKYAKTPKDDRKLYNEIQGFDVDKELELIDIYLSNYYVPLTKNMVTPSFNQKAN